MKVLFNILFLCLCGPALATPTVEALLKNGPNPDVVMNTVSLILLIKPIDADVGKGMRANEQQLKEADKSSRSNEKYVKIYFIRGKGTTDLIQATYSDGQMKPGSLESTFERRDFFGYLNGRSDKEIDKEFFYSTLGMLAMNYSEPMARLLKRLGTDFKYNRELVNKEKLVLLEKYRKYNQTISANPSLKNSLPSPLRPNSEEERARVNEIMNSNYYTPQNVTLVKEKSGFVERVELKNAVLDFSHEEHQLKNLKFQDDNANIEMMMDEYMQLNGTHYFPKFIAYKVSEGRVYSIRGVELKHMNTSGDFYQKTVSSLKKHSGEASIPFLY